MSARTRIVITGSGAICASGKQPDDILAEIVAGHSGLRPATLWDARSWPNHTLGEIPDYNAAALTGDRKLLKLIRRTDVLGLYASGQAIDGSGLPAYRATLDAQASDAFADNVGVYVGSGGGTFDTQYDYFPLLTEAHGDMHAFGAELSANVNPMWLLRTLPNNVLCHASIRYGLKGPNACITCHSVGGALAIIEAAAALRTGEAAQAVAIGHDAPTEPQTVLYYQRFGLVAQDVLRTFDQHRDGTVFGEGAGALVFETAEGAAKRDAPVLGEFLGGAAATEGEGLLQIRSDGDGVARAITLALADAGLDPTDVGMIVAHGNGTRQSDASEAAGILRVFGTDCPPVTGFKWAFGHLLSASGMVESVIALAALRAQIVPGIATLRDIDPSFAALPASSSSAKPRNDIALVISRGFGGTNTALLLRA
jgi:3-oxoacyl-[acyl-carrier-protein] synthase-1